MQWNIDYTNIAKYKNLDFIVLFFITLLQTVATRRQLAKRHITCFVVVVFNFMVNALRYLNILYCVIRKSFCDLCHTTNPCEYKHIYQHLAPNGQLFWHIRENLQHLDRILICKWGPMTKRYSAGLKWKRRYCHPPGIALIWLRDI